MGISLSSALLLSKVLLHYYYLLLYRLLFESLLLLDEPFYRTRERLQKPRALRVVGVVGAYITSPVFLSVKGFGVGSSL
jgi:hypothetical protein